MPSRHTIVRTIVILLAALNAPKWLVARVAAFDATAAFLFARSLWKMERSGLKLRYRGESLAIVSARLDMLAWMALDPFGALAWQARRARGLTRVRLASIAPVSFAPPALAPARFMIVLRAGPAPGAGFDDSS